MIIYAMGSLWGIVLITYLILDFIDDARGR